MPNHDLKFSGDKETFGSGATREIKEGKGFYDCLPSEAIRRLAIIYEKGAKNHGKYNYRKGIPLSSFLDSGLRHFFQLLAGQTDEDHASQAIWNLAEFVETKKRIEDGCLPVELDDVSNEFFDGIRDSTEAVIKAMHDGTPLTTYIRDGGEDDYYDGPPLTPKMVGTSQHDATECRGCGPAQTTGGTYGGFSQTQIDIAKARDELKTIVTAYLSHPIRGIAGDKATDRDMAYNNARAIDIGNKLREVFPQLDLYIPSEHDEVLQNLMKNHEITIEQILGADKDIVGTKDLLLVYNPQGNMSSGMQEEWDYALQCGIPTYSFNEIKGGQVRVLEGLLDGILEKKQGG